MADLVTINQVLAHLNLGSNPPADLSELDLFIDAATAHFDARFGSLPSATYTEQISVNDDGDGTYRYWLRPLRWPVTAVTSVTSEDGSTEYLSGFTISTDGRLIRHASVATGAWTVVYTAGQAIPADLKLAVLEDIRGLYQPGQIGPPATFGAFDIDEGPASGFRPVNLWPRIDAWVYSRLGPAIA